jgi:ferredoxin
MKPARGETARLKGIEIQPVGVDFLRTPVAGRFLRWRHSRQVLGLPLLALSLLMIGHGLFGSQLAPKNLATTLTWVHFRGALVIVLLIGGNFFCLACPFMLPRELARRLRKPAWNWPSRLRNKWLGIALFALVLFAYELFDLWSSPFWTAWLIILFFAGALVVDGLFKNAPLCKYVCPIGQFNFAAATVSPLEIRIRKPVVCAECRTVDCIRGTRSPDEQDTIRQRGCELALFQPLKIGNMDCTFCLDCVYSCPHDNIALAARVPGAELWADRRRSGIGLFSKRKDLAVLALLFTFGALLNAFGMVSPVYAVQSWLSSVLGVRSEAAVLGIIFLAVLVVEPVLLLGAAAWLTRRVAGRPEPLLPLAVRFAYALIPLGFGVWVAHYTFHLLTGFWAFIPVAQNLLESGGIRFLGGTDWTRAGLPPALVQPLEIGFLCLGLIGSLLVAYRIAERDYPASARLAFVPWAGLILLLWLSATWLLSQPMEMRGTSLGS